MPETPDAVTYEQIKGAIGSLIWLWSQIERDIGSSITRMTRTTGKNIPHQLSSKIALWGEEIRSRTDVTSCTGRRATDLSHRLEQELRKALRVRNFVCHGLLDIVPANRQPGRDACLEAELNGERLVKTWSELQAMFAWMSRTSWLIRDLTAVAMAFGRSDHTITLEGWKDFPLQR